MNTFQILALRLYKARESVGFSPLEVAEMIGVTKGTINNYERGFRVPKLGSLYKLCKVYGVSLDYLLGMTNAIGIKLEQGVENKNETVKELFSKRLREIREHRGFDRDTASKLIGVSKQCLHNYENGIREPDLEIISSISKQLEVSVNCLVGLANSDGFVEFNCHLKEDLEISA